MSVLHLSLFPVHRCACGFNNALWSSESFPLVLSLSHHPPFLVPSLIVFWLPQGMAGLLWRCTVSGQFSPEYLSQITPYLSFLLCRWGYRRASWRGQSESNAQSTERCTRPGAVSHTRPPVLCLSPHHAGYGRKRLVASWGLWFFPSLLALFPFALP